MFYSQFRLVRICDSEHLQPPNRFDRPPKFYMFSLCIGVLVGFFVAVSISTASTVVRLPRVTRTRPFTCAPLTHPRARRLISHENLLHHRVFLDDVRFIGPFYRRQLNGTIRLVRRRDFTPRVAFHFVFAVSIHKSGGARERVNLSSLSSCVTRLPGLSVVLVLGLV